MKNSMTRFFCASGVPARHLQAMDANIQLYARGEGEHLFLQGDSAPNLYFIAQGLATMFYVTHDGREFVKTFLAEGSFAALGTLFEESPASPSA